MELKKEIYQSPTVDEKRVNVYVLREMKFIVTALECSMKKKTEKKLAKIVKA